MKNYSSKQAKKGKLSYRTPSWFISERQRGNKVLAKGKVFISERQRGNKVLAKGKVFIFQQYKEVTRRGTKKK